MALRRWPVNPHVVALATHRSVLLFDIRCKSQIRRTVPRIVEPPSTFLSCVRSLNFSGNILSYGTSLAKVHFYDLVADKHLGNHLDIETVSTSPTVSSCRFGGSSDIPDDGLPDLASTVGLSSLRSGRQHRVGESVETELTFEFTHSANLALVDHSLLSRLQELNETDMQLFNHIFAFLSNPRNREYNHEELQHFLGDLRNRVPRRNSLENQIAGLPDDDEDLEDEEGGLSSSSSEATTTILRTGPSDSLLLENLNLFGLTPGENTGHPLGSSPAIYTHEYDSSGLRLFTAGGPIGSAFSGNFAVLWH